MPASLITAVAFFFMLFLVVDICAIITFLKARKKLKTLYTESMSYISAEWDYNMMRGVIFFSTCGMLASLWPLTWSVY